MTSIYNKNQAEKDTYNQSIYQSFRQYNAYNKIRENGKASTVGIVHKFDSHSIHSYLLNVLECAMFQAANELRIEHIFN